jgi:MtN3 and saliva related transmembrane protein
MTTEIIIGIGASIFTAVASVPQLLKLVKEKKADDISKWMYCVLLAGLVLWVLYGVLKMDWILIVSNSFSFLLNLTVLILTLIFKK